VKSYSQSNEQEIILNYFGDFTGIFLDIGANDGITLSNTYALVQKGWAGTLVEASPKAYERLIKIHPSNYNLVLLNVAVGAEDGEIEFYESGELLGKGDVALVSSTKIEETERWKSLNMPFEKITVPVVTFKKMLESTKHHNHYDLISIDIEGMEYEVVPQINFTALGTKMAIIEWNGKHGEYYDSLLYAHSLKLIHTNAENRIYAK
jgi:FkbM family methyltransferase